MFTGEDGTEIYGQEDTGGDTFALGPVEGGGMVDSVIEVAREGEDQETIVGDKAEDVQEFTFVATEDQKLEFVEEADMDDPNSQQPELAKNFECELCNKKFTKIEILKRHIKTHLKDKVR